MQTSKFIFPRCSIVGKPVPRIESDRKVTGKAGYISDIKSPGALHGKILRSPLPHARIKGIETSAAERLQGVAAVITHRDVAGRAFNSAAHPSTAPKDRHILADKARYVGDEVAAVAAVDLDTAEAALELIEVEYEELPAIYDPEEAMKPGAPRIHGGESNVFGRFSKEWGDVDRGFKEADLIFEDRYKTQAVHATPMEPQGCLVGWESGVLRIWSNVQSPHTTRDTIADLFNLPRSSVRLSTVYIGGAFGNKHDISVEPIAISLAMKTGRPVKMELTRKETFYTTKRHPSVSWLKTGVKRDGTLTAREVRGILAGGAYAGPSRNVTNSFCSRTVNLVSLYRTPNFRAEAVCVYTNTPTSGSFRGYGNPQGAFPIESQMDQIAEELGADPVEFRLKNCVRVGDVDPATGLPLTSCGLKECADRARREMDWDSKRRRGVRAEAGKLAGIGTAFMVHTSGLSPILDETCAVMVAVNSDGAVSVKSAAVDLGTGAKTALAQIVAEELCVGLDEVNITEESDTDFPRDRGCYGSGTLYISGEAARRAAAEAKRRLIEAAAKRLKKRAGRLYLEKGHVRVRGSRGTRVPIGEICQGMPGGEITATSAHDPGHNAPNFGVQTAEVEIDEETGGITVRKVAYAHDIGRAINPLVVEGQLEGGLAQGLGYALTENLAINVKAGEYQNTNFTDYKIPRATDYRKLRAILVETREKTGPYSGKGCGESSLVPTAAAVANAIYDATGIRFKEIPITPEMVLRELRAKKQRS